MSIFSVYLLEDKTEYIFILSKNNNKRFYFSNRKGELKREFNKKWNSEAREISNIKIKDIKRAENFAYEFEINKFIEKNYELIEFLNSIDLFWEIKLRVFKLKRYIKRDKHFFENRFNHFSININISDNGINFYVGEGNINGLDFNIIMLKQRIKNILKGYESKLKLNYLKNIPVVFESGEGGIFFHEIFGHSLEADYIFQGLSPFSEKDIGKDISISDLTIVSLDKDDKFFSEILSDDEGIKLKNKTIVEQGKITSLFSDYFYSKLLNVKMKGNSRLEDYRKIPMPRMYGLYIKNGKYDFNEIIKSVDYGILAREPGKGSVVFHKNLFYFDIKNAYLIEKGRLSYPIGPVIIEGKIRDSLKNIDMIGNDFKYDYGISYCYKNGQVLNVRVGQPSVKINNLNVIKNA